MNVVGSELFLNGNIQLQFGLVLRCSPGIILSQFRKPKAAGGTFGGFVQVVVIDFLSSSPSWKLESSSHSEHT
jgi:hypothetical protein